MDRKRMAVAISMTVVLLGAAATFDIGRIETRISSRVANTYACNLRVIQNGGGNVAYYRECGTARLRGERVTHAMWFGFGIAAVLVLGAAVMYAGEPRKTVSQPAPTTF